MENTKQKISLQKLLAEFEKPLIERFNVEDYKSVSLMRQISGKYSIQLYYGFNGNKNPIKGKPYTVTELNQALIIFEKLSSELEKRKNKSNIDHLFEE